jgi:aldehyde dehydrogenase (NAD+)
VVARWLDALAARSEDIARIITREMGKTLAEARGETAKSLSEARHAVARVGAPVGEVLPSLRPGVVAYTTRRPRGVVVGVCPWNFPIGTPLRKTIPALVYGNAMVLKASELAPGAAAIMAETARGVLPDGLFQAVVGDGALGAALTNAAGVDAISFTGSVATGRKVAETAARNLAEISLELGGKNPAILNDASDLDAALNQIYASAFAVTGQRCTAVSRLIVTEDLAGRAVEGLVARAGATVVGDGMQDGVTMGPLVSARSLETVAGFVDRARAAGAAAHAPGATPRTNTGGYFHAPTIVTGVTPDMEIAQEEVFGPVLSVLTYRTPEQALEIANSVAYGLTSCLFSEREPVIEQFLADSQSGMLHVNGGTFPEDHVPFVGVKASALGVGGSNGASTQHFFTAEHMVYRKARA